MSILRPSKEEILDHLRTSVITEAGKRTGFLGTTVPKLNVVRRVQQGQKLSFNEPYLALILQGTKKTYIADKSFTYTARRHCHNELKPILEDYCSGSFF